MNYEKKENVIVIRVDSPLDIGTSPLIQKEINGLINEFPEYNFIVNMDQVEYINSAGLGALIISTKKLESDNRRLKVTNLNNEVKKVIQLLDAHEIIDAYDNEEEAFKSFALCF